MHLTPKEAAERTGLAVEKLCRCVPHLKVGRTIRFDALEIDAFMAGPIRGYALRFPALSARVGRVYFVEAFGADRVKIGFTSKESIEQRMHRLRTASPFSLHLLTHLGGSMAIEFSLHHHFARFRVPDTREWFFFERPIRELVEHVRTQRAWP